jgi:hypothetical protein
MGSTLLLLFAIQSLTGAAEPANAYLHDLSMNKPLRIHSAMADSASVPVFRRVTLAIDLDAAYDNPFDSEQIAVDATVVPPEGEKWSAPGFLYRPYARQLSDGKEETVTPGGTPQWQVRLSLPKPGKYTVIVSAKDKSGKVESAAVSLEAMPADVPGMARRHPTDTRYFVTDRGETLYLVGANVCWGNAAGTFSYDAWLPKYAANGCNFFRVWLAPNWVTFAMNTGETGFDAVSLANAWRLDHMLEQAEQLGLRVMFCIDSFNILRFMKNEFGLWEKSPYCSANGGPLAEPRDYFTNETMLRSYRNRLRYLVARYAYSPSLFAWELWNEVDIIDQYDSVTVAAWHQNMARSLRDLDPWKHLIATSFSRSQGDPAVDGLPEMDFVQTHHYQMRDVVGALGKDIATKAAAKSKPHFHGEIGIEQNAKTGEIDPAGAHVHDAAYASVGQLQAGVAMTWWWDSYVEPFNLYPVFGAFTRWIEGFDFVAQNPRALDVVVASAIPNELAALGVIGKDRGLLWVHNKAYTWSKLAQDKKEPAPITGCSLRIENLPNDKWTIETWDTQKGEVTASKTYKIPKSGTLRLDLPDIVHDMAFRLRLVQ